MGIPMAAEAVTMAAQMDAVQAQETHRVSLLQRAMAVGGAVLLPLVAGCAPQAPNAHVSEAEAARVAFINTNWAPSDAKLDLLVNCEAGGNPASVSKSGKYRGLGQFDQRTWNGTMSGIAELPEFSGLAPNLAPEDVQRAGIRALYAARGRSPWPVCGRFLK